MAKAETVRAAFADQAQWCDNLGSPFTAQLMRALATGLSPGTPIADQILTWPGDPSPLADGVPLRVAGALHALVRAGQAADLAALYPPAKPPDIAQLTKASLAVFVQYAPQIQAALAHAPQSNEVGRAAALYAGLLYIAARHAEPIHLLELGASAGLNLVPDHYHYRFADQAFGDPRASVRLAPEWTGPTPPHTSVQITRRQGCDLNPLHVGDPAQGARLLSYIWPDQSARLARAEAAVAIARKDPPHLDQAEAADWLEAQLAAAPAPNTTRVVWHSIAAQYFPKSSQDRIAAALKKAGAAATATAPLAHLALEQTPEQGPALTLQIWPGGPAKTLALASPHVQSITWIAEQSGAS